MKIPRSIDCLTAHSGYDNTLSHVVQKKNYVCMHTEMKIDATRSYHFHQP